MRTGLNASDIPATENGLTLLSANEVQIPSGDSWFHFRKNAADGFSGWTDTFFGEGQLFISPSLPEEEVQSGFRV
jgi:hypothetical protein